MHKQMLNIGCGNTYHTDWINLDFNSTHPSIKSHNLLKGIPFPDSSFEVVYSSHFLEHLPYTEAVQNIKEQFRILKKGGTIRIVVPDLEYIVKGYLECLQDGLDGKQGAHERYEWVMIELFDQMIRNEPGGNMGAFMNNSQGELRNYIINRIGDFTKQPAIQSIKPKLKVKTYWNKLLDKLTPYPVKVGKFRLSGENHYHMYDRYSLSHLLTLAGFKNPVIQQYNTSEISDWISYELDLKNEGAGNLIMEAKK